MQGRIFSLVLVVGMLCSSAAIADGGSVYSAQCAKCHGADGQSDTPVGKAMKAKVLAGKTWSQEKLTSVIRENTKHKSISGKVSDDDLAALATFLPTLGGGS
jgi:mono/diheme cytochrome c family protein